ncbi:hypothetical protein [Pseudomonas sp. W2-17]
MSGTQRFNELHRSMPCANGEQCMSALF